MNLDQRLTTPPGFHGVPPGGVNAALIELHPDSQYGLGAAANPLKSLMAARTKRRRGGGGAIGVGATSIPSTALLQTSPSQAK
jgi:hypothetical protein